MKVPEAACFTWGSVGEFWTLDLVPGSLYGFPPTVDAALSHRRAITRGSVLHAYVSAFLETTTTALLYLITLIAVPDFDIVVLRS
jgi:hypothetical protein